MEETNKRLDEIETQIILQLKLIQFGIIFNAMLLGLILGVILGRIL